MEPYKDILRWVILIGAAPIWLPFLRILWRDFNHALRDEGGLIGVPPRGTEAERLRAEKKFDRERLTSEPILSPQDRIARRLKSPSGRAPANPRGTGASAPGPKVVGFRSPRSRGRDSAR